MTNLALARIYPDVEGAIRTYLRSVPMITDLVSDRVWVGFPKVVTDASFPAIVIGEVGPGATDGGDAPLSWEPVQFDCWGPGRDRKTARQVRDAVVAVLESIIAGTLLDSQTRAVGARVFNATYVPDPDNGQARYVVDAYIQASKIVTDADRQSVFPLS